MCSTFCFHGETGGGYELTPICPTVFCPFIHAAVRLLYAVTFLNCADWPKGVCSSICFYVMHPHIPWLHSLFAFKRKTTFFTLFWHKLRFGNTFSSHSSANTSIILGDIIYFLVFTCHIKSCLAFWRLFFPKLHVLHVLIYKTYFWCSTCVVFSLKQAFSRDKQPYLEWSFESLVDEAHRAFNKGLWLTWIQGSYKAFGFCDLADWHPLLA